MRTHIVMTWIIMKTVVAVLIVAGTACAQNLELSPQQISEGAKNVRLKVQRTDGRPFASQSRASLSVGIAFGPKLVMFDAKPDRLLSPQSLTVTIKDAGTTWSPAPRAGDNLLVAVYLNKRPVTTATLLPVVGGRSESVSPRTQRLILPLNTR